MNMEFEEISLSNRDVVINIIVDAWGSSLIISKGKVHNVETLPGFVALVNGEVKGATTYHIENDECEIVSLDSLLENKGIGSSLINRVIEIAKVKGCKRVWLITSNDNTSAMRFYQKKNFDMVSVRRDAITEARLNKPQIPLKGFDNIPIRHEIEFELLI